MLLLFNHCLREAQFSAISDRRRNTTRNTAGSGSQNTTAKPGAYADTLCIQLCTHDLSVLRYILVIVAIGISQPSLPSVPANAGKDTLKKKKDKVL